MMEKATSVFQVGRCVGDSIAERIVNFSKVCASALRVRGRTVQPIWRMGKSFADALQKNLCAALDVCSWSGAGVWVEVQSKPAPLDWKGAAPAEKK